MQRLNKIIEECTSLYKGKGSIRSVPNKDKVIAIFWQNIYEN